MAIAALILWTLAVGAGVALLLALGPARRTPAEALELAAAPVGARPAAGPDRLPSTPHTRVSAGPDTHPLLEFTHPALGVVGASLWFAYVFTRDVGFAWASISVLAVTILAGLNWLASNARAARRRAAQQPSATSGPPPYRLILGHGLLALTAFALSALTLASVVR